MKFHFVGRNRSTVSTLFHIKGLHRELLLFDSPVSRDTTRSGRATDERESAAWTLDSMDSRDCANAVSCNDLPETRRDDQVMIGYRCASLPLTCLQRCEMAGEMD
jgi:hypothetical protein